MNTQANDFESFLRNGLKAAAAGAPAAPSVFVIRQTLRRRGITRAAWISVAAALLIAAALMLPGLIAPPVVKVDTARSGEQAPSRKPPVSHPGVPSDLTAPVQPPPVVPENPPAKPTPAVPQTTLIAALSPAGADSNMAALRTSLEKYFVAHGITRAEITKEPGEEIDYVLRASGIIDFAQVSLDMQTLFKNYRRARLSLSGGETTCWLLAPAQTDD